MREGGREGGRDIGREGGRYSLQPLPQQLLPSLPPSLPLCRSIMIAGSRWYKVIPWPSTRHSGEKVERKVEEKEGWWRENGGRDGGKVKGKKGINNAIRKEWKERRRRE